MTDSEAVARCQNGDRDAFRHLVDRYRDLLFGTAVLMTGNRATAEEQVQEAFLPPGAASAVSILAGR